MSTLNADSAWRRPVAGVSLFRARGRALATSLVMLALCGCDSGPKPPIDPVLPQGDSPEAKLERVIGRLKFALRAAESAGDYGVVSKRESRYRLIPPSDKEPRPTAEVTIHTTVSLTAPEKIAADETAAGDGKESTAPAPKREKEVFLLVYDNDKWEMPTKPESETLQLCFESALRDE